MAALSCVAFLLWFLISTNDADVLRCHAGWTLWGSSCYNYGQSAVSWGDALDLCRVYGGKLAEVETAAENNFLKGFLQTKKSNMAWIGGTDVLTEGAWEWITTGNNFNSFKDWATGQPDDYQTEEDCLQYTQSTNYKWNDFACSGKANFLCEAEAVI